MRPADIIVQQLGRPGRALNMLGAKSLLAIEDGKGLQFRIGRNPKGVSSIGIVLDEASDTYTVAFWRIRGLDITKLSEHEGIHADRLHDLLESETGLRTRL